MDVLIYTISCPITGLVRYVGKTCNEKERFRKHLSENNCTKKSRWIKGLKNKGMLPVFEIIDSCTKEDWQEKERAYIRLFKSFGANLLNEMPGGEGGPTMKGKKLTAEQCRKISLSKKGKPNPAAKYSSMGNAKPVYQYDLAGSFIAKHDSIRAASRAIGRSQRRIQLQINGGNKKVNHVGGYKFSTTYILD